MKVDSKIRVGQLVKIKSYKMAGDSIDSIYIVVGKHGPNCELVRANLKDNQMLVRRWWNEKGLSVYA
jgi:predicted secreted Zn-dependent protease